MPTNKVAIIREIDVYCSTAGAIINFQGSGSGWLGIIYELLTVASSSWYQYAGRAVVDPGATLLGYSGVANTQAYVSGYLLDNL